MLLRKPGSRQEGASRVADVVAMDNNPRGSSKRISLATTNAPFYQLRGEQQTRLRTEHVLNPWSVAAKDESMMGIGRPTPAFHNCPQPRSPQLLQPCKPWANAVIIILNEGDKVLTWLTPQSIVRHLSAAPSSSRFRTLPALCWTPASFGARL